MNNRALFHLENVQYKHILDIPALDIPSAQITCILGPSGSGKTTFLRLLNKIISPDSGSIYYQAQELKKIKSIELRRKVCLLSQEPRIFEGNIKANLLQGIRFQEKSLPSEESLRDILDQVKLKKSLEEDSKLLSGGEKQRLALARILLLNPEVFLLDEPSSSLDDATEELIIQRITQEAENHQKTVVMVTHSKAIARKFADLIIHFSESQSPLVEGSESE